MTVLHAQEILMKIERTPKIFVATISGHALGGGLEIALACDFRFAAEGEFRLGLPEVSLGLLPGNGGTQRLSRLVGRTRALDMMITNQQVNSARALEIGMIERVFAADRLVQEAVEYVARLAKGPTRSYAGSKRALNRMVYGDLDAQLDLEAEIQHELARTDDFLEGVGAFVEKREAAFTGS